jgi:hypothetical protein
MAMISKARSDVEADMFPWIKIIQKSPRFRLWGKPELLEGP